MPFIETALIGDDDQENILHFGAVRYRVTGSGNLIQSFYGLDRAESEVLKPLVLSEAPGREPIVLANFKGQRALLRLETTVINEWFNFNRIILFTKPIYSGYAQ